MMSEEPSAGTPLFLLSGFLGSGKTTLLARLLREPGMGDTAIVVNEFGEVGLDHLLVETANEESVLLLDSGCLCCEIGNGLPETLETLYYRRSRGEIPPFSRVVVETTGLADPGPILAALMADRHLAVRFPVAAVIVTVDACNALARQARHPELLGQIALADRLVVTKTDRTGDRIDPELAGLLAAANPRAEILQAHWGQVDPDRLLATLPLGVERPTKKSADHGHRIGTMFLPIPNALHWEDYGSLVLQLRHRLGERLLRTKGVIKISGEESCKIVQGVGHVFAPLKDLAGAAAPRLGLVLIGEGLDSPSLVEEISALVPPR